MSFVTLFITLGLCQIAWILLGGLWVVRKHDEVPLLISTLLFYVFTFRFWALLQGWASPVDISNFGFDLMDSNSALDVQAIAILGETVLLSVYMLAQRRRIDVPHRLASPELLAWLKPRVLALGVFCLLVAFQPRWSVAAALASVSPVGCATMKIRRWNCNKAHGKGSPSLRMPTCSMALCFSGRSIPGCSVTVMAANTSKSSNVPSHAAGGRTSQSVVI